MLKTISGLPVTCSNMVTLTSVITMAPFFFFQCLYFHWVRGYARKGSVNLLSCRLRTVCWTGLRLCGRGSASLTWWLVTQECHWDCSVLGSISLYISDFYYNSPICWSSLTILKCWLRQYDCLLLNITRKRKWWLILGGKELWPSPWKAQVRRLE